MSSPTLRRPPSIDERYVSWMPHALANSTCDIPRLSRRARTRRPSSSAVVPVMGTQRTTASHRLAPHGSRPSCYLRPVTAALATAYDPAGWHDLFVAAAGATAALSGLIFVGLSVNIKAVLDLDEQTGRNFLSGRAVEALVDLLIVLVVSLVALTPSITRGVLAAVVLATAVISGISPVRALRSGGGIGAPDGAPQGRGGRTTGRRGRPRRLPRARRSDAGRRRWRRSRLAAPGVRPRHRHRRPQRLGPAGRDPPLTGHRTVGVTTRHRGPSGIG